jgi:hypothetical protein
MTNELHCHCRDDLNYKCPLHKTDLIEAQAAEIERLKKEVEQAWCDDAMPCRQLLDAKQDNERLRGLLKQTIDFAVAYADGTGTLFDDAIAEARAALAGRKEG